jgi:hypothetical protein
MTTFSLRIDDSLKAVLEARAKKSGKSLNQLLIDYITIGRTLDKYIDKNSEVLIKRAKGIEPNQPIILPVADILGEY